MKNLAPVGVSTYSRLKHLKQTIEALQKNTLAKETELYIFSDAPQKGDEEIVAKVREYIHTIDGFKVVHIVERETNGRVANNRGGIQQMLDQYGKMIFLEDDNVTSIYFLKFMNEALNYYQNNKSILTISGYMLDIKEIQALEDDVFLQKIFSAWGFATWKDRQIIEIGNQTDFICQLKGRNDFIDYIFKINSPMLKALLNIQRKPEIINPLDYKISAYQILNDKYTLYPKYSFVKNIGADGSGVHAKISNVWDVIIDNKLLNKIKFVNNVKYNDNFASLIGHKAMSIHKGYKFKIKKILNYVLVRLSLLWCNK